MQHWTARVGIIIALVCTTLLTPAPMLGKTDEASLDLAARYILETVKGFRTAYVLTVVEQLKESGVQPKEDWLNGAHAIPLPAQFVKAAGGYMKSFEIGLIGLTPVSKGNLPKTKLESDALMRLANDRTQPVIIFVDGNQLKGVSADLAIVQSCVDCHNSHPNSTWKSFKKWDIMGAVIVRINKSTE